LCSLRAKELGKLGLSKRRGTAAMKWLARLLHPQELPL
jgi:hypothetical protein